MSLLSLHSRPERALLPLPRFYHLSQLAAGQTAHVLAGPQSALRQAGGRYNGQECRPSMLVFILA